ncbi:MAG: hypothetical protein Q8M07_21710 [Prosthecobacter sp.]|nr:hypothetical protein [Prosthecobacter sp.]
MSMLDTVHHAGQEWLTKSTVWRSGGMQGDFEVKEGRLWLLAWDVDDKDQQVQLPPEDFKWHGVLELFRNLPLNEGGGRHRAEHRRLIFVDGQLLSETGSTFDVEHDSDWHGDDLPTDPAQRFAWQLHTARGMLSTILANSHSVPATALPALKQAETSISEALSHLEAPSAPPSAS